SSGRYSEVRLRSSPAHRGGFTQFRGDEPFVFEPVQGDVGASKRNLTAAPLFNRLRDRHTIRLVSESDQCQQDQELKASQELTPCHILNNTEEIFFSQAVSANRRSANRQSGNTSAPDKTKQRSAAANSGQGWDSPLIRVAAAAPQMRRAGTTH